MKFQIACLILGTAAAAITHQPRAASSVSDQVAGAGLALSFKEVAVADPRKDVDVSARSLGEFGGVFDPIQKDGRDKAKKPEESSDKKSDGSPKSRDNEFVRRKGGRGGGWKKTGGGGGGSGSAAATGPTVPLIGAVGLSAAVALTI
ncbi:hypothetical protein AJ78_02744 [Emergomyces pasteurianus Ep9510]|uniref:Uncharacterized protein n=1 Tax=Emergomyces pasteurianus Ep9510 TaxID=1447872 RepID=A0A1J9PM20_9EURO|nr:hypothetical protein AJ78_02744 [Emergomyces pasteurianus Ep9510]